ncbi:MAG: sodium-translocating pyrophosphatase [Candidatus Lokiarchaeota archaeon]|nr:sodium-translocating pyrophosphatase [Candidatus Lokiarchaeota archaeon]
MVLAFPPMLFFALIASIASILIAVWLSKMVIEKDPGNEAMQTVAGYIEDGANAFLKRQYTTLAFFVAGLAVIILLMKLPDEWNLAQMLAYLAGSAASAFAGWLGMKVGVKANTRTAHAAKEGLSPAFNVSFFGGAVMGLAVVGAALGGVTIIYMAVEATGTALEPKDVILGFSFGASSIALFAKCGGGIYTKTADVAADLVGKGEFELPEDDPRNPAAVADNVGDNVGDIAGMGADLFDSYVASILAAIILGTATAFTSVNGNMMEAYPMIVSASGLIASLGGIVFTKSYVKDDPGKALNNGTYISTAVFAGINALVTFICTLDGRVGDPILLWKNYAAGVIGLLAGVVIGMTTDYYTNDQKKPTQNIAESAESGHATVILSGFAYGLESIAAPTIGIVVAMAIAWQLGQVYGVASASVGMLAIIGTIVSNDAYGPIVDNARGIAEQGGLEEDTITLCDHLDSAGNTAKAVTKGFAIGAAALTVLGLLYSFIQEAQEFGGSSFDLSLLNANVMVGAVIGSMMPAIFSAVLVKSVQENAEVMIAEIHRQYDAEPGILKGEVPADFAKCIDIATKGSLKKLAIPIFVSIAGPVFTGLIFGTAALAAYLVGTILTGFMLSLLMSNSGGAWDNAKKYIEDGHFGGKGTLAHKASITGDTVGDPMKDTAGPSINTLQAVQSLSASLFLPLFLAIEGGKGWLQLTKV